ncbi:Tetratricopeptide-like helical domain [Phytophthora cactorum]|nr:Tetratricopeptide-like helical domain [Phytophthora cactorum]
MFGTVSTVCHYSMPVHHAIRSKNTTTDLGSPVVPNDKVPAAADTLKDRIYDAGGCKILTLRARAVDTNRIWMEVTKLHGDLTQCWLAQALVHVLERAATQCQTNRHILVSVGAATIAEQGAVLSALVRAFLRRDEALVACNNDCYTHVDNIGELQQLPLDQVTDGMFIVVYAPCEDKAAVMQVEEMTSTLQNSLETGILLVLHNPIGLLGLEARNRGAASSTMYHLSRIGAAESENYWETSLKFIAQPLDCLRDQCGWHFVMEIVRWISGSVENKETFGAARATMFSTINQLPFQLLLLVLRWTYSCLRQKAPETNAAHPQARVRRELVDLQRREEQIWIGLYPSAEPVKEITMVLKQEPILSPLFIDTLQEISPKLGRLSECSLWNTQKQFYKDQGIRAWSSGKIPFGVSSSSFLAAAYARIAVDFLLSNADCVKPSFREKLSELLRVGGGKWLVQVSTSFMLHFTELVDSHNEFRRRGLVPLVVATDLSEQVLNSRRQMTCFRQFIERGQLDFALFDTYEFVRGDPTISGKRKTLKLVHSQRQWYVGSDGPVALMGNYFLDSLRADIFTVGIQRNPLLSADSNEADDNESKHTALLDKDTSSIANMNVILRQVADPRAEPVYEDGRLNAILVEILDQFHSRVGASTTSESFSSTGLVLFPVEAFEFLLTLFEKDGEAEAFPIAILAGDARFPSETLSRVHSSLPRQSKLLRDPLSKAAAVIPHPDCFCLPVAFEIFALFLAPQPQQYCSQLVSAPASDTFDVFFATVERRSLEVKPLPICALHTWRLRFIVGMMSFDDGARCFSMDTLLALLAQTGWDFDLFSVIHWELLGRLKRQEHRESEHYQSVLIEQASNLGERFTTWSSRAKRMSSRESFVYNLHVGFTYMLEFSRNRLTLSCTFSCPTELEAYENVLEILMPWRDEAYQASNADDVDIFYLLGLASLRSDEYWTALSYFRICGRLAPTKTKFQRQVARTLLALQTLKSSSNSSNESVDIHTQSRPSRLNIYSTFLHTMQLSLNVHLCMILLTTFAQALASSTTTIIWSLRSAESGVTSICSYTYIKQALDCPAHIVPFPTNPYLEVEDEGIV